MTELVARPLIALEHPELAGLVQPLAGGLPVRLPRAQTVSRARELLRRMEIERLQ